MTTLPRDGFFRHVSPKTTGEDRGAGVRRHRDTYRAAIGRQSADLGPGPLRDEPVPIPRESPGCPEGPPPHGARPRGVIRLEEARRCRRRSPRRAHKERSSGFPARCPGSNGLDFITPRSPAHRWNVWQDARLRRVSLKKPLLVRSGTSAVVFSEKCRNSHDPGDPRSSGIAGRPRRVGRARARIREATPSR